MLASFFAVGYLCLDSINPSNFDMIASDVANILQIGTVFPLFALLKTVKNSREGTNFPDMIHHTPVRSQR